MAVKRPNPKENEIYRHFKGSLYQIVTVAVHTETSEKMVIYRSIEKPDRVFARPLEMFMSEVDHLRYPLIRAKYRFTLMVEAKDEPDTEDNSEAMDCAEVVSETSCAEEDVKAGTELSAEIKLDSEIESDIENCDDESNPCGCAQCTDIEQEADKTVCETAETSNAERMEPGDSKEDTSEINDTSSGAQEIDDDTAVYKEDGELVLDPIVERVLDAKEFTDKIAAFELLRNKCTEEMLTTLAISLDVQLDGDTIEEKYAQILKTLRMHEKYESSRLRP